MCILEEKFGNFEGVGSVNIYTLTNANGMKAKITNYGGVVVSLYVPDKNGKLEDVVLGYDNLQDYLKDIFFFGAIIGRYANRIEDSSFELNGSSYALFATEGKHHLHGGIKGFDKVVWEADVVKKDNLQCLQLSYLSVDGEENYPGNLDVKVIYSITDDNSLKIDYYAVSDKDTVVNLTNHSYFNLSGHECGDILKHELKLNCNSFTPIDGDCIPTGEIRSVKGTPLDFTTMRPIGEGISANDQQILYGKGFDHNLVISMEDKDLKKAAEVFDPSSGRVMEVYTTKPGIQFYSGNNILAGTSGKNGAGYNKRSGFCLETQYFPNSLKHRNFPSPVIKAGQEYRHTTIYKFSAKS
ncbi:MAG: galactose mutarotase [Clostridiaceae bacterium]|nr:galactose mutarotase [Clostridiaceae bacterium]